MAIVKMKKLTLAAPQGDRLKLLNKLQGEGCVELFELDTENLELEGVNSFNEGKAVSQTQLDFNRIKFTYDFLTNHRKEKPGLFDQRDVVTKEEYQELEKKINWQSIYEKAKEIDDTISQNKNEKGRLLSLIEQYRTWADLDVSDKNLKVLKKTTYFIGSIQVKYEPQLIEELNKLSDTTYVEKISARQQDVNILAICHNDDANGVSEILKKYGFTRLNMDLYDTPRAVIAELSKKTEDLEKNIEKLLSDAVELSESIKDIEKMHDYLSSKLQVEDSMSMVLKTNKTFILNGWVPVDNVEGVEKAIKNTCNDAYVLFSDPAEGEEPPVVLKNKGIAEPFEAITSMYAMPQASEIDPTPIIAPFYLLFFGMMMADIGYGLLMFIIGAFLLKKMDADGEFKNIIKVLWYCSIPTIFFGILYGGFFGGIIPVPAIWVNPVDKPMVVLVVSIIIGAIHLFIGLGIKGYMLLRDGKPLDALMDVGSWYVLLIGLVLMLLSGVAKFPINPAIGKTMAIVGAAAIVLTNGRENESLMGKFFGGIYALYGVTGYLGDALSYSRLLALGLSSGLIGWAFNLLISLFPPGVIYIAGPIVFVAGHTFNFLIGGLGTFVHSSRLIYLEFFGKFYEGGGKAFQPLKLSSKFIKVNTER